LKPRAPVTSLILGLALLGAPPSFSAETPIDATAAYREAFGPPPKSEAPNCRAAVVFLPGVGASGDPARLGPLPLFSLDPEKTAWEAARVLVEGYPTRVRFFEPPRVFGADAKLSGLEVRDSVAIVTVTGGPAVKPHPLAVQALAHTLAQFPGISSAVLRVAGQAPGPPHPPDPSLLESPPRPRLLDVVSSVHPGEEPTEIDVLFDRPVTVDSFTLRLENGTGLPGKTYTSMFDMAVVFRPEDPKVLREGLPLEVSWRVEDRTGRKGGGAKEVALRVYRQAVGDRQQ
jgi:hypothetical protein